MGVGWILLGESPKPARSPSLIGQIYGVANQTASVFLTQITGRFGYSTVKTNLLTVGPYSCATAVLCKLKSIRDLRPDNQGHLSTLLTGIASARCTSWVPICSS